MLESYNMGTENLLDSEAGRVFATLLAYERKRRIGTTRMEMKDRLGAKQQYRGLA